MYLEQKGIPKLSQGCWERYLDAQVNGHFIL